MASAGEVFCHRVDIRDMEFDAQGVVVNGWYLTYFDEAMAAFLRHRGLPYADLLVAGYDAQLLRTELERNSGLRWGDDVCVAVATAHTGRTSFPLDFQTRGDGHEDHQHGPDHLRRDRHRRVWQATDPAGPRRRARPSGAAAVDGAGHGPQRRSAAMVTKATADLDRGDRRASR